MFNSLNPIVPFSWGAISLFLSGKLLDSETVLGYIIGIPILIFALISIKELGKLYILKSTLQLLMVGFLSLFLGAYLANTIEVGWLSGLILAIGLSIFLASMVPIYFRFFKF